MRKLLVVVIGLSVVSFAAPAWATKLTEKQVRTVCGKELTQSAGGFGCDKKCGTKQCTYGCVTKGPKKDQGCYGHAMIQTGGGGTSGAGGGKVAPGLLEGSAATMQTGGPAAAGSVPRAPAAPASGGGLK